MGDALRLGLLEGVAVLVPEMVRCRLAVRVGLMVQLGLGVMVRVVVPACDERRHSFSPASDFHSALGVVRNSDGYHQQKTYLSE